MCIHLIEAHCVLLADANVTIADPYAGAGGGEAGSNGTEVDVEAEEREVLSMACAMGVGRQDVEQALLDSAGNWELVLQVLRRHLPWALSPGCTVKLLHLPTVASRALS